MRQQILLIILFFCLCRCGAQIPVSSSANAGARVTLAHIVITGNRVTRRSIILRELSVQEGRSVSRDSIAYMLRENKLRLANLALFTTIDLNTASTAPDALDLLINVKERW